MLKKELLDILTCPQCKGGLDYDKKKLICKKCRLRFAVENDIPDMLISDAEKY